MMSIQLAQLDSRKRVSLAKIATADTYIVTAEPSGRIVLEPAVVMTEAEAHFLGDSGLRERVASREAAGGPSSPRRPRLSERRSAD